MTDSDKGKYLALAGVALVFDAIDEMKQRAEMSDSVIKIITNRKSIATLSKSIKKKMSMSKELLKMSKEYGY